MTESPELPDAELLRRSRTDDNAFRLVYDRHATRVFGFLESRCDDRDSALDLTSEVFARAWLHRRRFRDEAGGSALPWLFGIARNVLRASVRGRRVEAEARRKLGVEARGVSLEANAVWLLDDNGEQRPPALPPTTRQPGNRATRRPGNPANVHRRDRLGGLIHEYETAA